ncbi:cupin domain-containing protein [Actinoplanes sp. NPDC051633]|uniref:cupin domain-containing protein n=1 Tax=Actinoplanes sp. NPDC051633 TaxID=3155670 RepID=UPI003415A201
MTRPPLAEQFDLQPHPEGGWFRETFRSEINVDFPGYAGPRAAATAIYFVLHPGEQSAWHTVRSDELWFWHSGGPLELRLGGDGPQPSDAEVIVLGITNPQALVPKGVWQSAVPAAQEPVMVSCVVSPGFDFADFRLLGDPGAGRPE